jgi:hypothetical protein
MLIITYHPSSTRHLDQPRRGDDAVAYFTRWVEKIGPIAVHVLTTRWMLYVNQLFKQLKWDVKIAFAVVCLFACFICTWPLRDHRVRKQTRGYCLHCWLHGHHHTILGCTVCWCLLLLKQGNLCSDFGVPHFNKKNNRWEAGIGFKSGGIPPRCQWKNLLILLVTDTGSWCPGVAPL